MGTSFSDRFYIAAPQGVAAKLSSMLLAAQIMPSGVVHTGMEAVRAAQGGAMLLTTYRLPDMTGEELGFAMEVLLSAGALDVYTLPIGMKKNRPGVMLNVLCRPEKREELVRLLFLHTTTIGVRETRHDRYILRREEETMQTPFGPVRGKSVEGYGVRRSKPEYEDLRRIALEQGISLRQAREAILRKDEKA